MSSATMSTNTPTSGSRAAAGRVPAEDLMQVERSVVVDAPAAVCYDQWTQFEAFPKFLNMVDRVQQTSPTDVSWKLQFRGMERTWHTHITEQYPGLRIAWVTNTGDVQIDGCVTFHTLDVDTCKIMLQVGYDQDGFAEWWAHQAHLDTKLLDGMLQAFAKFVEANGGTATGSWDGIIRDGEVRPACTCTTDAHELAADTIDLEQQQHAPQPAS